MRGFFLKRSVRLRSGGPNDPVVVIGGGVIGAVCAWYLREAGHDVTIIDKGRFAAAYSHGNCGSVSPSHGFERNWSRP